MQSLCPIFHKLCFQTIFLACAGIGQITACAADADEKSSPETIGFKDRLPYGQQPVDYLGAATSNAGSRLNRQLVSGAVTLEYRKKNGYLQALLKTFQVPVASQLLVFSKTAANPRLVKPVNPRAVYFNDEVTIGWVPGAASLEVAALDPLKGPIFYTLLQSPDVPPRLVRTQRCLTCHAGTTTLWVPGLIVRSFLTNRDGKPIIGYSRTTHDSPLSKRWGGWYVTGSHGRQTHTGNVFGTKAIERHREDSSVGSNTTDLTAYFDVSRYESPHSDIVAHLVLDHQMHGLNLLTRAGYESRLNRRSDVEQRLVRYLLFLDEPLLTDTITGTSGYARRFAKWGPSDSNGRSLRQLDLKTRLFKYRLSYLIYSPLFNGLPAAVKGRLYRGLWDVLTGNKRPPETRKIPSSERAAILEIVRATKNDLPGYWKP
jgi:hypothetical protein